MNNPPSPNQPISSQQLITENLNRLSSDLANQMNQTLTQQKSEQQTYLDSQLTEIATELSKQLWTKLSQQITEQTQQHNQQITDYLNALSELQKSEIATLEIGREELKSLQNRLKTALTKLEELPASDISNIQQSLESLQVSVSKLEQSTQDSLAKQQNLTQLTDDLTYLKTTMQITLSNLQTQQAEFASYLEQLKTLV